MGLRRARLSHESKKTRRSCRISLGKPASLFGRGSPTEPTGCRAPPTAQASPSSLSLASLMRFRDFRSRQLLPARQSSAERRAHGCGHNLLGSGAALAAVAVKDFMAEHHVRRRDPPLLRHSCGRRRLRQDLYGALAGLFKDVDVVLHWHPADRNAVNNGRRRWLSPLLASPSTVLPLMPRWLPTADVPRSTL